MRAPWYRVHYPLFHVSTDEQELLERCRKGDRMAWAELYAERAPQVKRFLWRLLGEDNELDELVQQTFVELFRSLPSYREEASLSTWLYRICANLAGKRIRTATRTRRREQAVADAQRVGPAGSSPPDDHADARRRLAIIFDLLEELGPHHRMVWMLREVEGLSGADVAEALGIPPGTMRSRLHEARRRVLDGLAARQGAGAA